MKNNKNILIRISVAVMYLAMITINALANILPINNISTGEVSDNYINLFTPASLTFSIWGLIYLLLAIYVLYQFGLFQKDKGEKRIELCNKIGIYFILSSLANISWILAWHYDFIALSVILIIIILFCLIKIADLLRKESLSLKEKLFILWPFSIYFAWITVATIANITTFLVLINWSAWGLSDEIWTVIILVIGAIIAIVRMLWDRNIPYGLVFIWAYLGILIKHLSLDAWAGQYPYVINTVIICLLAFVLFEIKLLFKKRRALK